MNKSLKKHLYKIIVAIVVYALALLLSLPTEVEFSLFLLAYLIVGGEIVLKALRNISKGQVFDENFLMTIATLGAFVLKEYSEAVAVMLFFQVGEFFQKYAVNQSRRSIAKLMDIRPDYVRVLRNGELEVIDPEEACLGEIMIIQPGERIALDGIVLEGFSNVDTAALTGEAMPREVGPEDEIISGCINISGMIKAKITSVFAQSTVAKILNLVENASSKKANIENFITRFARYYTPTVVIVALLLAIFPPLLLSGESFHEWIYRAITFLVISCPCALVISVPLSFFGGLGAASKCGVLIKGSNYLEALAHTRYVVFDKTGTLTKGCFRVTKIVPQKVSEKKLIETAAYVEAYSTHPIAESIRKAYGGELDLRRLSNVQERAGQGIEAELDGLKIAAGNLKLLKELKINVDRTDEAGTIVYVLIDGNYAGYVVIADEIKDNAAEAIAKLREAGVTKVIMLTGDREVVAKEVAKACGVDDYYAGLLPVGKVEEVEKLLSLKKGNEKLLFVGDGINDAPVLARSDIGTAMGGIGSDAAIEAADVVIMNDDLSKIASAIKISRKTLQIAKENIVFAIGIKLLVLGLGAAGFVSIWAAVFADVGVSVIAILNAMRALFFHKKR